MAHTSRALGLRWDDQFTQNSNNQEGRCKAPPFTRLGEEARCPADSGVAGIVLVPGNLGSASGQHSLPLTASPPELQTHRTVASLLGRGAGALTYIGGVIFQERASKGATACKGGRSPVTASEALRDHPEGPGSACLPCVSHAWTPSREGGRDTNTNPAVGVPHAPGDT